MADIEKTVVTKMTIDASQPEKVLKDVEKGQKKLGDTTKKTAKETSDYSGALQGVTGNLGKMSGAGGSVVSSLGGMTKGMGGLKGAMVALPIFALVAAVTALSTWFNRTAEGQEKLAIITAGFGQLLETFLDIVSGVGEALFSAFENPKQAIKDLVEFIKQNLINRFEALGLIARSVGRAIKGIFDSSISVKEELGNLAQAAVQFGTGLDAEQQANLLDAVNDQVVKLKENIEAATSAQRTQNDLRRQQIAFTVRQAELRTTINEQLLIANDRERELSERAEAAALAEAAQNELIDEKIRLKSLEIEIAREQDAINDSNLDDAEALARLDAELIALGGERAQGLKRIQSLRQSITKEAETEAEKELQGFRDAEAEKTAIVKAEAEAQAEAKKEADDEAALAKIVLEKEVANSIFAISDRVASLNKELAIFNIILSTARAIAASAELGFPAAIPGIIAATALGAIQLGAATSAKKPSLGRGGRLFGLLHSQGGIPAELEDGEAVLNRVSMADPLLRQMASDINQAGGGVAFAQQGMLAGQATLNSSLLGLGDQVERSLRGQRTVLVTEDLNAVQNRVFVTEETASL